MASGRPLDRTVRTVRTVRMAAVAADVPPRVSKDSAAGPAAAVMSGHQLVAVHRLLGERTDGAWSPSPGAIYPTLNQLEDEGLVRIDTSGGRKEVSLTEVGRAHVEEHRPEWPNPLASEDGPRLRELMHSLSEAVRQVGRTGTDAQRQQTARELTDVRRRIYLILAGDEE